MIIIHHRRNTIQELKDTPQKYGVEVDIRCVGKHLIIHHDPFVSGECFEKWLKEYNHGTLILNVKEEGLEEKLIYLMKEHNITDYFFLDQSFPFLIRWSNKGEHRCAVRVSEFESVETALSLAGKVDWVWLDCFTDFPINKNQFDFLKDAAFKICLVSPELQGRNGEDEIKNMSLTLKNIDIKLDAVCTKHPYLWEKMLLKHA